MLRGFRNSGGAAANLGVCILAGCALIAAATWASGDSTPRRLSRGTHVGVPPSATVMLTSQGLGSSLKFYRLSPDGTVATSEYTVPTGVRLMVTDVEFATTITAGVVARLYVENRTTTTTRNLVALVPGASSSSYGGQASPVTGFSVSPAGRIVADAVDHSRPAYPAATFPQFAYPQNSGSYHLLLLRGYEVTEE